MNCNEGKDKDTSSFDFTVLFHNYFVVSDVTKVQLEGLPCCEYKIDKVTKNTTQYKDLDKSGFTVNKATDSVFANHSWFVLKLDLLQKIVKLH